MKPLKTWQIVLLVIFYPVGICVLIYRLVKKSKIKREAEERSRARAEAFEREHAAEEMHRAEIRAKVQEDMRLYDDKTFKIVGVTYKNADRHSRQTILRRLKHGDAPFDRGEINLEFKKYDFEGEPAVGVYLAGEQVGNIAKDDLPYFLPRMDRFVECVSYEVVGGGQVNGEKISYGLRLTLRFEKESASV